MRFSIILAVLVVGYASAQQFDRVEYLYRISIDDAQPRILPGILTCNLAKKSVRFDSTLADGKHSFLGKWHEAPRANFVIDAGMVASAVYERTARPRYGPGIVIAWPLLLTKEKKHFLTIQYATGTGEAKYAIFRLHKENYQEALAAIEAALGAKIQRTEER